MTNFEKLCEIFPHAISSSIRTKYICPSSLYGLVICKESIVVGVGGNKIEDEYSIEDKYCRECAEDFWGSEYDGARDYKVQIES